MVNGLLVTSVLLALSFVLIGGLTLSRDSKSRLNRYFMLFSASLAVWLIANYLAGNAETEYGPALIANKLTLAFGGASTLTILLFVKSLAGVRMRKKDWYFVALSSIAIATSLTPLVVSDVKVQDETYAIEFGLLSVAYFLAIFINAVLAIRTLVKARKHSTGVQRAQIYVVQTSFALGLLGIIITNAVVPVAFGIYSLTSVGSFFSSFFVFGISYAIIKHKLFDIRLVVARSLAYALLLTSLVGLYGIVVFGVADAIFGQTAFAQRVIPILTALLLAFTTPYLRSLFDRITNKIFYRDAYDPQQFISQLNQNLVTNVDIDSLLSNSIDIIEQNMKSQYCVFVIRETSYVPRRIVGRKSGGLKDDNIEAIHKLAPQMQQKVVVADYLNDSENELASLLRKDDISILVRLTATVDLATEGMGYILLGPKKSGNPYNSQDIKLLDIIANELVIAIQNALRFEEIEKFNITLQEKVDDATKKLRHTNEKLKAMDETKDEFISMASHQLRTPLTSVKGYLSMVLEGDAGEVGEMQKKLLNQAFVSSQRMVYLIADLLNVSRLRTGRFVIEPVLSNLADVVEGEVSQLKETAEGRHLELTFEKPDDFPQLYLDETKIRQVIMNFTDNAIYYTPSGGHIKVKLEDKGESIELTVNDDGMGVPKTEQPHLFTKFYRAGNARKARPDGTGLGLFMAKKVIVAQGGSVIFHSQEGKGSTFGFMFPKAKLLLPPVAEPDTQPAEAD